MGSNAAVVLEWEANSGLPMPIEQASILKSACKWMAIPYACKLIRWGFDMGLLDATTYPGRVLHLSTEYAAYLKETRRVGDDIGIIVAAAESSQCSTY